LYWKAVCRRAFGGYAMLRFVRVGVFGLFVLGLVATALSAASVVSNALGWSFPLAALQDADEGFMLTFGVAIASAFVFAMLELAARSGARQESRQRE
jgi:hypothetical protein